MKTTLTTSNQAQSDPRKANPNLAKMTQTLTYNSDQPIQPKPKRNQAQLLKIKLYNTNHAKIRQASQTQSSHTQLK